MSTMPYEVTVSVGTNLAADTWTIVGGEDPDYGPLAGLSIVRDSLDGLWPPADATVECKFQLLVPSYADAPHVRKGAIVNLTVKAEPDGDVLDDFKGRVSDLKGAPHRLGVLLTLVCVDFTADLRARDVTFPARDTPWAWPLESAHARFDRVVQRLRYAETPAPVLDDEGPNLASPAVTGVANAFDYLQAILRDYVFATYLDDPDTAALHPSGGYGRAVLAPYFPTDAGIERTMIPPTTWAAIPRWERPDFAAPLRLAYTDGQWSVVAEAGPDVVVVPASAVEFSSEFSQTRDASATVVRVRYDRTGEEEDRYRITEASLNVRPEVPVEFDTLVYNEARREVLANLYLPDEPQVDEWVADTFRYRAALDLPGTSIPRTLGDVATVSGIPPLWNPTGQDTYAGRLSRRALTISGGQVVIDFQLRRSDTSALDAVTFDSPVIDTVDGGNPLPTFSNVDPSITFDELRLVRGSHT